MSASIWRYVRGDLHRILLTVPGLPSGRHWEGKPFTPTPGVAWLREAIEKGPSTTHTLGSGGLTEERAIYLVDVMWPTTSPFVDGEDMADKIRLAFWHGREIASSGPDLIQGRVISSEARRTVVGDTWITFPIRIQFWIHRATAQA